MKQRTPDAALNRSAALASIGVALFLVGLKGWAAWSTGSTAMLGSLADTALDLFASMVTLAGVWVAAQPDDSGHRFGHGKAEALAAMFQVVLISISALSLGFHAVQQLLEGARTQAAAEGIGVSVIALVATLGLLGTPVEAAFAGTMLLRLLTLWLPLIPGLFIMRAGLLKGRRRANEG